MVSLDSDDTFTILIWLLVMGGLAIQCMVTDTCAFDAYGTCMHSAAEPEQCERLLPQEWRDGR